MMNYITYEHKSFLRFEDMDAYGILHHSRYLLLVEEAKFAFMSDPKYFGMDVLGEEIKFLITEIRIKYKHAIQYETDKPALVRLKFMVKEDIKIVFMFDIYYNSKLVCSGEAQHVVTDCHNKLQLSLPNKFIERYQILKETA